MISFFGFFVLDCVTAAGLPAPGLPNPHKSGGSCDGGWCIRYLAIRGCSAESSAEDDTTDNGGRKSAREQQEALVWKVWRATARLDYSRPGLA